MCSCEASFYRITFSDLSQSLFLSAKLPGQFYPKLPEFPSQRSFFPFLCAVRRGLSNWSARIRESSMLYRRRNNRNPLEGRAPHLETSHFSCRRRFCFLSCFRQIQRHPSGYYSLSSVSEKCRPSHFNRGIELQTVHKFSSNHC